MSAISPIEIADEKMVVGNRRQGRFTNRPRCPIGERTLCPSTGVLRRLLTESLKGGRKHAFATAPDYELPLAFSAPEQ
jgi:hypothetical protein